MRRHWRSFAVALALIVVLAMAPPVWRAWTFETSMHKLRSAAFTDDPKALLGWAEALQDQLQTSAELAYYLAVVNRRAGHTNQAREHLERARRLDWSLKDLRREEYLLRFQSGDVEETGKRLLALAGPDCPNDQASEIFECLVMGYMSAMRLTEAGVCLDFWQSWQPDAVAPHLLRAEMMRAFRDRSRAAAEYEAVLAIAPDNIQARKALAEALLEGKDTQGAQRELEHCLRLAPHEPGILISLAACYRSLGRLSDAGSALEEALKGKLTDQMRSFALAELGNLALSNKNYRHAVELLKSAVELAPQNAPAHYTFGLALSRVGDTKQAERHFEVSRQIDEAAARYVDVVQEVMRDPWDADLRCQAGEISLQQAEPKFALAWFQSALRCDPSHSATHKALARYYAEAGRADMADRHLALADASPLTSESTQ